MECQVCSIIASSNDGKDVIVFETKKWRVVLDSNQRFLGKAFVTLREHKQSISDLDVDEWNELREIMTRLETGARKAFAPSHFNWSCLMNDAASANESTHMHWHFHPRYKEPVLFADEEFKDGELYPPKERSVHYVSNEVLQKIAQAINS